MKYIVTFSMLQFLEVFSSFFTSFLLCVHSLSDFIQPHHFQYHLYGVNSHICYSILNLSFELQTVYLSPCKYPPGIPNSMKPTLNSCFHPRPTPLSAFPLSVNATNVLMGFHDRALTSSWLLSSFHPQHSLHEENILALPQIYAKLTSYFVLCYHLSSSYHHLSPGLSSNPPCWNFYSYFVCPLPSEHSPQAAIVIPSKFKSHQAIVDLSLAFLVPLSDLNLSLIRQFSKCSTWTWGLFQGVKWGQTIS